VLASGLGLYAAPAASRPWKTTLRCAPRTAGNGKQNANCVGDNMSPPLAWSNPPDGTKSLALLMFDPEGRGGLGVSRTVTTASRPR
jgi:phosphatidylethanolamine-binding protein (PEBP) family uncharacterized protein